MTTEHEEEVGVYCVNCGTELTEETGVLASPDWYESTRYVHLCRKCQQSQFEDFADNTSPAFAYFLCCAAYNLPFIPECMPSAAYDVDEMTWLMYLDNLENNQYRYREDGEPSAFADGMTDLGVLFGGKITAKTTFASSVTMEGASSKLPGTKAQRRKWGTHADYTTEDYKELDRLYAIISADREENGIDGEMEFILRRLCKLDLDYDKAMAKKDYVAAKRISDMRSDLMGDYLLRKKDEAPLAPVKLDTLIDKLEKEGLIKSGDIVGYDQVLEWIIKDQAHYYNSHDLLDYIILAIINCIRRNFGQPETDELPWEFQFTPMFNELEPEMTKAEKKILEDLGLPPMKYEKMPKQRRKKGGKEDATREAMEPNST